MLPDVPQKSGIHHCISLPIGRSFQSPDYRVLHLSLGICKTVAARV